MAIKDYKVLVFELISEGELAVEKSDVVDIFKSYLKRVSKGDLDLKIVVGVNLKRRQNLSSYKKQVVKGLNAHKSQLKLHAQKLGLVLDDNFVDTISGFLNRGINTDNLYDVKDCSDSFVLINSDIKITKM